MAIRIRRKPNTRLSWEANSLFTHAFPVSENVFIIPNINWMVYLHKYFDLIEATYEDGTEIDLRNIMSCCRSDIHLEVVTEPVNEIGYDGSVYDELVKEDENVIDPIEEN